MRSKDIYTGLEERHSGGLYLLRYRETEGLAALRGGSDRILCLFETPPDAEEYLHNWFNEPGEWVVDVFDVPLAIPKVWLNHYPRVTVNPPLDDRLFFHCDALKFMRKYRLDPPGTLALYRTIQRRTIKGGR